MKWIIVLLATAGLLAAAAVGGWAVGREDGKADTLEAVGEYLIVEQGTPPWAGQEDSGFKLCLALKDGDAQKAAAKCLAEIGEESTAEETPESDNASGTSGSPTPQPSPTVAPTASATPSPTPIATARPTRDGSRD